MSSFLPNKINQFSAVEVLKIKMAWFQCECSLGKIMRAC